MLISVEGLDGVGKSYLVDNISKKSQMPIIVKLIKSILELNPSQANKIKEKIYSKYSSNVQSLYYLLGYLSALEDGKKHDYIFDRGFYQHIIFLIAMKIHIYLIFLLMNMVFLIQQFYYMLLLKKELKESK